MKDDGRTDILIIIPPAGTTNTVFPPYGAMYVASALREKGYCPKILNVDTGRIADHEVIERIRRENPRYIGFSGIVAPSYRYIKELSLELKDAFPDRIQILGGGLSSAAETVLANTAVDIVVYGEGDLTAGELMDCLERKGDLSSVPGIYYRSGTDICYTGERELVRDLDALPYPAFDLVDMDRYLPNGVELIHRHTRNVNDRRIYDRRRKRKMMTLLAGRGCFGRCSFCFRAYPGIRFHSMRYVFDLIEYCADRFDAGFFSFGDECFTANKARHWEFINEYRRRKMDFVFRIQGARVDTFDRDILRAYKEIGCWMIEYGFESGSQKMLNIIDKRVTVEQNRRVALWTREAGIHTSPTLVLAMPGEDDKTIQESIEFLKSLDFCFKQYQWTFALPIAGSPLYEYARLVGAIIDEDEYLSSIAGEVGAAGVFHVNLTSCSDEAVVSWPERITREVDAHYFRTHYRHAWHARCAKIAALIDIHIKRRDLLTVLAKKAGSLLARAGASSPKTRVVRYRARDEYRTGELFKPHCSASVDPAGALALVNKRLREGSLVRVSGHPYGGPAGKDI